MATGPALMRRLMAQRAAAGGGGGGGEAPGRVVFAYLSQTGTAEEICGQAHALAAGAGLPAELMTADAVDLDGLRGAPGRRGACLVLVAASTGDGEAPQGAVKFFAQVKRGAKADAAGEPGARRLLGCRFAILGLGDSNYTSFMKVPRDTRRALLAMGAEEFLPAREADEVDGLESVVDPWLEGLLGPLRAATAGATDSAPAPALAPAPAAASASPEEGGAPAGVPPLAPARARVVLGRRPAGAAGEGPAWPSADGAAFRHPEGAYTAPEPFWARVAAAPRRLSSQASDREVVHLELDVAGSGLRPQPGDAFGVMPPNAPGEVARLLARLSGSADGAPEEAYISGVEPVEGGAGGGDPSGPGGGPLLGHLGWPCPVRHCLEHRLDVTSPPRKTLLRFLADHASDAGERREMLTLCCPAGRAAFREWQERDHPALLDVLERFPSCRPPLGALLARLPAQQPRMYSLSCAPEEHPDSLHCAFTVVPGPRPAPPPGGQGRRLPGLATAWLAGLGAGALVPVHLRAGGAFSPPEDLERPVVMIGPGTGVAPFRGFLQRRRRALASRAAAGAEAASPAGEAWLFFGCRSAEEDYLYREDLEGFAGDGTLNRLELAFSREQAEKVYVQHRMLEHAEALRRLIFEERGYVFVCGDGAGMAKDVHAALARIAGDAGEARLKALVAEGRYVRDIWTA